MSSIYRVLCLSHDPAITTQAEYSQPEPAAAAIASGIDGHQDCDLLIGRYSYPLIEVGCPPTTGPERAGQHRCYPHSETEWVDVAWLRILAAVHQNCRPCSVEFDPSAITKPTCMIRSTAAGHAVAARGALQALAGAVNREPPGETQRSRSFKGGEDVNSPAPRVCMRGLADEPRLAHWPWERLRRLRDELGIDVGEPAGQSGEAPR